MKHGLGKCGNETGAERETRFGRFGRMFQLPRVARNSDAALIEIAMTMIKTDSGKSITEREPALYGVTKSTNEPGVRFCGQQIGVVRSRNVAETFFGTRLRDKVLVLAPAAGPEAASEGQRGQAADAHRLDHRSALLTAGPRPLAVIRRYYERQASARRVADAGSGRSLSGWADHASSPIAQREVGTNNFCGARSDGTVVGLPDSGFVSPLTAPVPIPSVLDLFGMCLAALGLAHRYAAARRLAAAELLED